MTIQDIHYDYGEHSGPAGNFLSITPSDSTNFGFVTRGIYVGGAGNVAVVSANGETTVTFVGVPAGAILPVAASRVNATNTTATNLVGLYG